MKHSIGLIVGSGYGCFDIEVRNRLDVDTPYGAPSSDILQVDFADVQVWLLIRHGESHTLAPHEVNYQANLWALHEQGVKHLIAINTVGSIVTGFGPSDLAVPDQLIDYTWGRKDTYGDRGRGIPHLDFTEPLDPELRGRLADAASACGFSVRAGTYGVTQGPRLETAAEIDRLARDGCAMVGMTAMPEAILARELGMAYAIVAVAVNYAAGRSPTGLGVHDEMAEFLDLGMRRAGSVIDVAVTRLACSNL